MADEKVTPDSAFSPAPAGKTIAQTAAPATTTPPAVAAAAPAQPAAAAAPPAAVRRAGAKGGIALQIEEEEAPGGFMAAMHGIFKTSPSWLTSMVVHIVMLLVLGLLTFDPKLENVTKILTVSPVDESEMVDDLLEEQVNEMELESSQLAVESVDMQTSDMPTVVDNPEPTVSADQIDMSAVSDIQALSDSLLSSVGSAASGEDLGARGDEKAMAAAVAKGGGNAASESAVAAGLDWLARHQNPDGSWSFDHRIGPCQGRCDHPGSLREARFGATGMGLLPFLGAGQTHKKGKYKDNVKAGLTFLAANMKGGSMFEGGGSMYSHGIATIALTEAFAMTHDKGLHGPAQAAVNFIVSAQDPVGGGWRYAPRQPGDTSAVGWQVMALKSGHMGYLAIPPNTIVGASKFLDSVQADGGAAYGYDRPGAGQATTAIGLLCRMYLGWKKDNPALQKGVALLDQWGPSVGDNAGNMYYNYYGTQVMHHMEGELWKKWNEKMRDHLIKWQSKEGHMAGSWHLAGDHGSEVGGRLYSTAMSVMTLEVYYRHSPIYSKQSTENEFEE